MSATPAMMTPLKQLSTQSCAISSVSNRDRTIALALGLVLLTVLVYSRVGRNSFINFDDNQYILANPHVRAGLSWGTVKWAFTSFDAANWHPITWLSHAIDCELFGLNASAHHFMNILLHALNVVLVFLVFQSLTGFRWRSFLLAALFAVHPLNVETVAWAAERKTVLSTAFFLLAMWTYVSYVRRPALKRYVTLMAFFALALMSKPQAITLPFALLLLDFWPLGRTRSWRASERQVEQKPLLHLVFEKIPLFVCSVISAGITMYAQRVGNAVRTAAEYSIASRVETALISYLMYIRDLFFPYHLVPIYPHPTELFASWIVGLAIFALVGTSALAILWRNRAPYFLFGWLWFLGTLVPMIGLVQVGLQARADRYMYFSMLGILVAVICGLAELMSHLAVRRVWKPLLSAAACLALSIVTYGQIGVWKNSETLWAYTISVTKDNFMAEDNLAQELATQGRTEEALVHFHNILKLHNWEPSDLIAFGLYEQNHGHPADAIHQYQSALQKATDATTRAVILCNIGSAYLGMKDVDRAKERFDQALRIDPGYVPGLLGSGIVAQKDGNLNLAVTQYEKALSIKPSDLGYFLLGLAFDQSGRSSDASKAYGQAKQLSANFENTRATAEHLLAQ